MLGKGAFGKVYLVTDKNNNNKRYALKMIFKNQVMENDMLKYVYAEKNILQNSNNPFIIKLH